MKNRKERAEQPVLRSLRSLQVRPILPEEEAAWNERMAQEHYLGFRRLVGEALKYVALLDGEWVALLAWAPAALKCRARDAWIGWTPERQWQRLRYVVNNQRFLLLPAAGRVQNLASKTLALNLKRLSADWEAIFGHPVVLAETFVDPRRFRGTSYQAANWQPLGLTRGFGRRAGEYHHHGQPKVIWVRPLRPDARALLSAPFFPPQLQGKEPLIVDLNQVDIQGPEGLLARLRQIADQRSLRGIRHKQAGVLAIAAAAVLSGARGYKAIAKWAKHLPQDLLDRLDSYYNLRLGRYVAPSESTFQRVLGATDAEAFDRVVYTWLEEQVGEGTDTPGEDPVDDDDEDDPPGVALDGKTLRGARRADGQKVHLMAAIRHQPGDVIAQTEVATKTNEISAFQPLLDPLDLAGKVVTADALHAQRGHARYLVEEKQADYLFTVKANQPGVLADIQTLDEADWSPAHVTNDKGHGRIERRSIQISTALEGYIEFPFAAQVLRLKRTRWNLKGELLSHEMAYGITSLTAERAGPEQLLRYSRRHWYIENGLHWVRDVTFDEDRSQIRTRAGPRVLATLRNLAISLFRRRGARSIAERLWDCAWANDKGEVLDLLGV